MTETDRINTILDANTVQLVDENQLMREELTAIRDLAYRGHGAPADALEAILSRANAALRQVSVR